MTIREIGERGDGTRGQCCIANVERLQNLKWKAYKIEWKPVDQRTSGGARQITDEKGETEKHIYNGNRVLSKGARHWGRIRKGSSISPAKQGIHQWRDMVESQKRGKCRGYCGG